MPLESPGLVARQELSRMGAVSPPMIATRHAATMCAFAAEVHPYQLKRSDPVTVRPAPK